MTASRFNDGGKSSSSRSTTRTRTWQQSRTTVTTTAFTVVPSSPSLDDDDAMIAKRVQQRRGRRRHSNNKRTVSTSTLLSRNRRRLVNNVIVVVGASLLPLLFLLVVVVLQATPSHAFSVSSMSASSRPRQQQAPPSLQTIPTTTTTTSLYAAAEQSKSTASTTTSATWKPKLSSLEERRSLRRGRSQPQQQQQEEQAAEERIGSIGFHHVEFYCGDAKSTAQQLCLSLGLSIGGITSQATGNDQCVSYGLQSGSSNFRLLVTAPYSQAMASRGSNSSNTQEEDDDFDAPHPLPNYTVQEAHAFFHKHGLAARAVALEVQNATHAFEASVATGAVPVLHPTHLPPCKGQQQQLSSNTAVAAAAAAAVGCTISEVELYGDVVLRYISFDQDTTTKVDDESSASSSNTVTTTTPFLPHLAPYNGPMAVSTSSDDDGFGIYKIDHAVGNVPNLQEAYSRIQTFTGFHEFAEFTTEDVGTVDSGLNSVVLASDSEDVLLPLNEPTFGSKRKSQIQTYLEQNEGAGLQHLALKTRNIFATVRHMQHAQRTLMGLELMQRPSDAYYRELPDRLGELLTEAQYRELEELGILADADDEGVLLQLFTKPVGDRPTFFFEIIQRIGCVIHTEQDDTTAAAAAEVEEDKANGVDTEKSTTAELLERPGCGGFGQGNFRELFKSIEEHEKTLKV